MSTGIRAFTLHAALVAATLGLLSAGTAVAADNSGIVIIDQQQRSTPFGSYDSRRQTQVFGPSSGFRYEEYRTPVQPVYPQYRNRGHGHDRRGGGYAYGPSYRGDHREGRVFQHYGPGAYGRHGAPAAPRINGYANPYRHHDGGRGHHRDRAGYGRAMEQPGRAIQPAERAIGRDRP